MNAGIPGVGIAGLFFVVCALLMPFFELGRTVIGRSSVERWRVVARNWLLAVAMVGVFVAMGWAVSAVPKAVGRGLRRNVPTHLSAVAITVLLLLALLAVVQVAAFIRRPRRQTPEPRREKEHAL